MEVFGQWAKIVMDNLEMEARQIEIHLRKFYLQGVASLSDVTPQSINLTTINFDDAFAEHGNGFNPATYYSGVSISCTYFGVVGGVGNGDQEIEFSRI